MLENSLISCPACMRESGSGTMYCGGCGIPLLASDKSNREAEKEKRNRFYLYYTLAFYGVLIILLSVLHAWENTTPLRYAVTADIALTVLSLLFILPVYKGLLRFISPRDLSLKPLYWMVPVTITFVFILIYINGLINRNLFGDSGYILWSAGTSFPLLYGLLSTALHPAIFEELTFRGLIYTHPSKIMTWRSAVVISGFMFAVAHLSVISLFWLIPVGVFYGYLRHKYKTIWYGVILHFIHNSIVVFYELYFS